MSGRTNWRDVTHKSEPKQTAPKGLKIPVPKHSTVMDAFKKIAGKRKNPE
jgi:hypothetical protein